MGVPESIIDSPRPSMEVSWGIFVITSWGIHARGCRMGRLVLGDFGSHREDNRLEVERDIGGLTGTLW